MSDWKMQTASRHWLNLETFILCVEDVALLKKVNMWREQPGLNDSNVLLPGLEIILSSGESVEIDYVKEDHRDQVFNTIWEEIAKMGKVT